MSLLRPIAALGACLAIVFGQSDSGDSIEKYRKDLQANPASSLAHFRIAEIFVQQKNYQSAANEFREALNGDLQPKWTEVWSHINLGKIFELTKQHERAVNEYRLAGLTNDNTRGALDEAAQHLMQAGQGGGPSGTFHTSNIALGPEPVLRTEPEYSEEARSAGLEGTVFVSGAIAEDGSPRDLKVTRPLGLGLDAQALDAVKQWRYAPIAREHPVPAAVSVAVDFLLPENISRWHLVGVSFRPPEGASRPVFLMEAYPPGPGISLKSLDQGQVLAAIRRLATVTLSFDVDERGFPGNFHLVKASDAIWGPEAIALVRGWRFTPGSKDGVPISVPCSLDLIWGQKNLTAWSLAQLREATDAPQPSDQGSDSGNSLAVLSRSEPSYTDAARQAKLQGTVRLSVVVGEDGIPKDVRVLESLGLGLDENAIEAVYKWRFRPPLVNGHTVATPAVVEVNFRLMNAPPSASSPQQ